LQKNCGEAAMNVAIVIDELDMGGAQHVVYELVKHINTAKYNITIICTDGGVNSLLETEMLKISTERNFSIIFLKTRNIKKIKTKCLLFDKIYNKLNRILLDFCIISDLAKELKILKPDIVHAHQHGIWAVYWTLFHGIPVITTIHTNPQATFSRETERIIFHLSILFRHNSLIGISEYNALLIKNYWNLDDASVRYVNNGIDINNYYSKPHDLFAFINVSRQDENKNQSLILRAFARLHRENSQFPMRLFLIGDGITHELLKNLSKELGIDDLVFFTGYIISAAEYLAISDVYVSSSHREGLPLSVLEAMAARLPVIATDTGGIRDLAQENGILIADEDEDGLYLAMKTLRDNDELRLSKGAKSLDMVQSYSAQSMADGYSAIYDEIVKKK
jgi:glycosyltransferase involved in cell wall biosynthesis